MVALAVPCNIQNHAAALVEGLSFGDKVHISIRNHYKLDNCFFIEFHKRKGVIVGIGSVWAPRLGPFLWTDIIELWPLEEKPNLYHSDISEVSVVLKKLEVLVKRCVKADDSTGVLYFLDQVAEVRKAELILKKAYEINADV